MDYQTIRFIWWLLIGVLLIGFAIMDGQDLGVGILNLFVAKEDSERRIVINSVAPHWDGNQVWLLTFGGALFAAWPLVYATFFSGLYVALLLLLWTIFLRPVAFEYRSKITNSFWRKSWDFVLFLASFVPVLIFGVAIGNLFIGLPFYFDDTLRSFYTGSFFDLLNPFGLLCGLLAIFMICFHGANYLCLRTVHDIQNRSKKLVAILGIIAIIMFIVGGIFINNIDGYIANNINPNAFSNPLIKNVLKVKGAWLFNYQKYPFIKIIPVIAVLSGLFSILLNRINRFGLSFLLSSLMIAMIILTVGVSLYPFLMPSSIDFKSSLTLYDATSSSATLKLMFVAVLIFVPLILIYTSWAYKVMWGKLTKEIIEKNSKTLY